MTVGVQVTTVTRSAPSTSQQSSAGTFFLAGLTERGPSDVAVKISSLADFERYFGGYVSYGAAHAAARTFFEEGGGTAYVARTVGPAATLSTLTLVDKAGTPVPTLRIDAYGAGAWGTGVIVDVDPGTVSGTYKLTVTYAGTGAASPETYDNLVTPADAVRKLASSAYVRATDLGSATSAPNNQPASISPTALSGGSDDRSNVLASHYVTSLGLFGEGLGAGAVAIPGQPASSVGAGLVSHAVANNRVALVAPASGQTINQAITAETTFAASLTSGGEYTAMFWPWIKIPDGAGGTYTISPEPYAAAARARAHGTYGPAKPGAGLISAARFVVDVETPITLAQNSTLSDAKVSGIVRNNGAIMIYGWRSLSTDVANYELLTGRDVINYCAVECDKAMVQYVFRTIDGKGQLFSDMAGSLTGVLEPLRATNNLFERTDENGGQLDPGYKVDTGPGINTAATAQQNVAKAAVSVRPSPSAELVQVEIAKVPVTGNV